MEVRILLIGRYFTLAGPAKSIRVARPEAVDLASIKIKNSLPLQGGKHQSPPNQDIEIK